MRKFLGFLLVAAALIVAGTLAATAIDIDYWMAPPAKKFAITWAKDVELLEKSGKLPEAWKSIREITLKTDNSVAQDWIVGLEAPIVKNPRGKYRLEVFIIHQMNDTNYGAVVQYNLVDLTNSNTTWELGRTLQIGRIF